jgi:3'-phosphoadenosine 5'-phosphosulfate sulfotransferase (PAPS reductase)/FAD synthetase
MSFGGGVQSTTLALLAAERNPFLLKATQGLVPEAYIFADTGDERVETYKHIDGMRGIIEQSGAKLIVLPPQKPLSLAIIEAANTGGRCRVTPPLWVLNNEGKASPVRRSCTAELKVRKLDKAARSYFNVRQGRMPDNQPPVMQWLGISRDEMRRMKVSTDRWREIDHPLINMNWTRDDCKKYLLSKGLEVPRSSCVFCPFHGSEEWQEVREHPANWKKVLEVDQALRNGYARYESFAGLKREPYLLRSLQRVDEAMQAKDEESLFDWECAGVCGV